MINCYVLSCCIPIDFDKIEFNYDINGENLTCFKLIICKLPILLKPVEKQTLPLFNNKQCNQWTF